MNVVLQQAPALTTKPMNPPNTLTFLNDSEWVFRINFQNRTIELNNGFDWDDAGKLFWEHILKHAPAGFTLEEEN